MYIVVTGYEMLDNYITKGGKAFPVALVRVGDFIQSKKYTYKRVYKEDGTYRLGPSQYAPFALIIWYVAKTIYLS